MYQYFGFFLLPDSSGPCAPTVTKGKQHVLGLALINSWEPFATTSTCFAEVLGTEPSSFSSVPDPADSSSRLLWLLGAAALSAPVPRVRKPLDRRGVESESPCHFHPVEARGAPGDSRKGKEVKAVPSSALHARLSLPISAAGTERPQRHGVIVALSRRGTAQKNTRVRPQDC